MATFKCRVVSAREELYAGDISVLVAAGHDGEIGILAGHTPLITLLRPGTLRLKNAEGAEEIIYVSGGVLEVQPNIVTVLADSAERAQDLDEAKIAEARRAAEQLLANQNNTVQTNAALAALAESVAQLQTIQKYKNRA
ncbi:ATP synthase F0F1 subunit epsilon [Moraxella ovis]|uniref:ATP synthase epsilon chain n=1 Tax=Moraxella ovis TaxID=29433 RepID=A4U9Z2_9GAMM|nr:F0F1 ATP synthase subunit epsilon [Moraxella ovis]ABF71001.1 ATP synthase F1 epsilon subunit [Moraxella ovis]ANB90963.1 ATP synthase F0F1 subunit epsilon [Moraxella ovis]SPX83087.1 F-ATPase epsilon subunit [Moraxella ovis]STY86422.1 F-ATPase epsilon subunit [Moraxella ovis]STZ06470.1 F-ATPase epsilon subunit [Moraxella ovis]